MDKEQQILHHIRINPFISQQELAGKVGLSRPAVANYIAKLTKNGDIRGRAYILNESPAIVCIGGANTDRKARTGRKVRLYTSNPVKTVETHGGVARNTAGNLSLLGQHAQLIACVGDDKEGQSLLEETRIHGVDVSHVWVFPGERTGTFTTLLDPDGVSVVSMADMHIYDNVTVTMLTEKWPVIAAAKAVFIDTNLPENCVHYLLQQCNDENIPVYIDTVSPEKACKLPEAPSEVEVLFQDMEEAEVLADMQITTVEDCKRACEIISRKGVKQVVIMLEEEGVYYYSAEESGQVSPLKTEVVDVTGGRDALAACVMHGLMNGETFAQACRLGLAGASLTLRTENSISTLLKPERIEALAQELFKETDHDEIEYT